MILGNYFIFYRRMVVAKDRGVQRKGIFPQEVLNIEVTSCVRATAIIFNDTDIAIVTTTARMHDQSDNLLI